MNEDIDRRSRKKEDVLRGSRGPSHVIESKKEEEVTSTQVSQCQGKKSDILVRY